RSSPLAWSRAVRRPHALAHRREQVGDPLGDHAPQARLPRTRGLTKKLLKTRPLRPGEGRECTLLAALALATGADYDLLMGASGAAFTTTIDIASFDPLAAAPLDAVTIAPS